MVVISILTITRFLHTIYIRLLVIITASNLPQNSWF